MSDRIAGLFVALATPLDESGGVDRAEFARHATALMAAGCDGVVPFGTTGEGPAFTVKERLDATEALLAAGIAPDRIALGTGCAALPDTVACTKGALALGLTHAMVLPPFYFRDVSEQGIEDAFAAVIDGVGSDRLRLTAYHIPQVSGVPVPAAALGRLRARYGRVVAGVKDSTGDFDSFLAFRAAAPEIGALVGDERQIGRALAAGGAGTICGMANIVPGLVRAMFAAEPGVADMQAAIALLGEPFLPRLKSILAAQTGHPGWRAVRPALRPADAAEGARAATALAAIGLRQAS